MTNHTFKRALAASAAVTLALGAPGFARAQGAQTSDQDVSEVVVTGSRLRHDVFSAPYPLATVSGESVRASGYLSLGDVISDLPMLALGVTQQNTSNSVFFPGQARIDLRGLGPARTLVLMDGRRVVASDASSPAVDLNMIPALMVERVDIVPGAASAIYGSEAIGGVVNLAMRNRFQGFEARIDGGISGEGDGEEYRLGALWGHRSRDGRLSVVIGAEGSRSDLIKSTDRDFASPGLRRSSTVPQTVIPNSRTNISPFGVFQLGTSFAVALDARDRTQVVRLSADCSTAAVAATCQDPALVYNTQYGLLQGKVDTGAIRGHAEYEVSDRVTAFAEATFARVDGYGSLSPTFSTVAAGALLPVVLTGDNAFLNGAGATAAALRAQFAAANRTLTSTTRIPVGRYFTEFGGRDTDSQRDTIQLAGGMKGDFRLGERQVNWDWHASYGRMRGSVQSRGFGNINRILQATDAVLVGGQVVCRSAAAQAAGCVPFDLINGPSAAAVAWTNGSSVFKQRTGQTVVAANFTTDLITLPAGPLALAAGAEYRRESSSIVQDALGASGALFVNAIGTRAGHYDVKEAYAELRVPLLKDLPFAKALTVELAGRIGDYSTVGGAEQYRLAAEWAPVEDIRFRATRGTAVRAPNIVELYAPPSVTFATGAQAPDPCDRLVFAAGTAAQQAVRRITCAAFIPNYNPATFVSNVGPGRPGGVSILQGGNAALDAESTRSHSIGAVFRPRFAPGLQVSVDWFTYKIDKGISQIPVTALVQQLCYESREAPATNPFCAQIVRDTSGATTGVVGGVIRIENGQQNVSKVKVEGYDYALSYRFDTASLGRFDLRVEATWTYQFALQGFPGQPFAQLANVVSNGTPEWRGLAQAGWSKNRLSAQWTVHYLGSMISTTAFAESALSPYYTGDYFTHDLRAQFEVSDRLRLQAGVLNLTDRDPPALPETYSGSGALTGASIYDNRGRFFFLGAVFKY